MITSAWGFLSRDRTRAHYRDRKHSGEREQYGFCLVSLPPPHWYFSRTQLQINCVSIAPRTLIRLRRQIIDGLFSCDRVVPGRLFSDLGSPVSDRRRLFLPNSSLLTQCDRYDITRERYAGVYSLWSRFPSNTEHA